MLAAIADVLGRNGISVKSVVQRGSGAEARLVMVTHRRRRERDFYAALEEISRARLPARAAARDPGGRGGVRLVSRADRALPRAPADRAGRPGRLPRRGLDAADRTRRVISERVGLSVYLKIEGANPTGSFKDRGMTVAVSRAVAEGAEAVICASTGQHRRERRRLRGPGGAARRGDRSRGQDRDRQARPGADARRPRHRPARQLRRCAADRPRARRAPPDRARQLGQPVPDRGPEDRRLRGLRRARRGRPTRSRSRSATPAT